MSNQKLSLAKTLSRKERQIFLIGFLSLSISRTPSRLGVLSEQSERAREIEIRKWKLEIGNYGSEGRRRKEEG